MDLQELCQAFEFLRSQGLAGKIALHQAGSPVTDDNGIGLRQPLQPGRDIGRLSQG
jgi:hypothetical protein